MGLTQQLMLWFVVQYCKVKVITEDLGSTSGHRALKSMGLFVLPSLCQKKR